MHNIKKSSARADIIFRRTYCRPLNNEGTIFETFEDVIERVISHQEWLWSRALNRELGQVEWDELNTLKGLMLDRKVSLSGRTLWLGNTEVSKRREISMFNCSALKIETVYDFVDCLWLLLNGAGVGFKPVVGTLNGFLKPIKSIEVIRSTRIGKGGNESNEETWDPITKTWVVRIGDSAESWSRALGKLLAGKFAADKFIIDCSNLRPAGERLKGYGWISSGDEAISKAFIAIANILNKRAGSLLTAIDILDIGNWLGTILSSRRSAQIAIIDVDNPEASEFAIAKKDFWLNNNEHRCQSNNSLLFSNKPNYKKLREIFDLMIDAGGSEPGFLNGEAALRRAPWFSLVNPCGEILLNNKGLCNLCEIDVSKFLGDSSGLKDAIWYIGRANYRQTCVELNDGILQESWDLNNKFLRLCGVGLTGIAKRSDLKEYDYQELQREATVATYSMADELGLQRPKNTSTIKPSGTLSKAVFDCPEGIHTPLGKYIFNNVNFSKHDPFINKLKEAGYKVINNPVDPEGILVTFPVKWDNIPFTNINGTLVNIESAISQLEKYKLLQNNWTQQNTSVTISYSLDEVEDIINWLLLNWDSYVGVSFIYRTDPTKTAKDLGYLYLPQEVVTQEVYEEYVNRISDINVNENSASFHELDSEECAGGSCPIK